MSTCFKLLKQVNKQCKECGIWLIDYGLKKFSSHFPFFFTFATSVKPNMKFQEKCVYIAQLSSNRFWLYSTQHTTYVHYNNKQFMSKGVSIFFAIPRFHRHVVLLGQVIRFLMYQIDVPKFLEFQEKIRHDKVNFSSSWDSFKKVCKTI